MAAKAKAASKGLRAKVQGKASKADRTQADLRAALEKVFGMVPEDAQAVAEIVEERFRAGDEVNDETIDAEVRSLFYTLEARRLLSFRREEYETDAGEKRRAFWWRIRTDVIQEIVTPEPPAENEDIYASLPAECWQREAAARGEAAKA